MCQLCVLPLNAYLPLPPSQFSCSFLGETSQLLFNRSYIRQLADDARVMRCKADSTRESNGNRWTPLLLTLYLQVRWGSACGGGP